MALILLGVVGALFGGIGLLVFICALPFLLKPASGFNRFGQSSQTSLVPQAIFSGVRRAFDFSGRSNAMDFWCFAILVFGLCVASVFAVAYLAYENRAAPSMWSAAPLSILVFLAVPSLAVAVRRLHDVNKSGWWVLLLFVFGYFILLYWFFQPSNNDSRETAEAFGRSLGNPGR